jgi:hypothetical protein
VAAQLGALADDVVRELHRMGVAARWRSQARDADDLARALGL